MSNFSDFGPRGNDGSYGMRNDSTSNALDTQYMDFGHDLAPPMPYAVIPQDQHSDGKTQLHRAVIGQDLEQVRSLLFSGAAVNVKDNSSNEPLHYACLASLSDIVSLFLRFGADVNARGQSARTPLHMAATNLAMVNSLLKEGAGASSQDAKGDTPMHVVLASSVDQIDYKNCAVIDALLQSGCDINTPNNVGLTSFHKILDQPKYSALMASYIVKFLEMGASVSILLPDGRTPLQVFLVRSADAWARIARWDGKEDQRKVLSLFLDKGVKPTELTPSGKPLIADYFRRLWSGWEVDHSWAERFCKLLDPGLLMDNGDSILHLLAAKCSKTYRKSPPMGDLMGIVLRNGADPNHRNQNGETALHLMFREKSNTCSIVESTVPILLDYGADPWLQDSLGRCAMFEAVKRFPKDSHRLLKALFEADLKGQWESLSQPSEDVQRTVWHEWDQARRASDWSEVKQYILDHRCSRLESLVPIAFAVLAEKHLRIINEHSGDLSAELAQMAAILQDCRSRDIAVAMQYFDRLLDLCVALPRP